MQLMLQQQRKLQFDESIRKGMLVRQAFDAVSARQDTTACNAEAPSANEERSCKGVEA